MDTVTERVFGEFGFDLTWEPTEYYCNVSAYRADDSEVYLKGYVKWDGCTELDMGCPHWCGPDGYIRHAELLKHIYHRAFELMKRTPDEAWPS